MSEAIPVEVESNGTIVRGWLYPAEGGSAPTPAVAMIHGFSATAQGMVADRYAAAFAEAGVAALLADPRTIGRSDGEPRGQICEWWQAQDYLALLRYLRSNAAIDPTRVGLWGDSMTGRVAAVVAAVDGDVAALVVQTPVWGDEFEGEQAGRRIAITQILAGDLGDYELDVSGPLPVVSLDQIHAPSLLLPPTAYRWFLEHGARFGTAWMNAGYRVSLQTPVPLDPQSCAPHLTMPVLAVIAEEDEMPGSDADVARAVFETIPEPKELVSVANGHFGLLWEGSPDYQRSIGAQAAFLRRHLVDASA